MLSISNKSQSLVLCSIWGILQAAVIYTRGYVSKEIVVLRRWKYYKIIWFY